MKRFSRIINLLICFIFMIFFLGCSDSEIPYSIFFDSCDGSYGRSRDLRIRHEAHGPLRDWLKGYTVYSSLTLDPLSSLVLDSQIYPLSSPWCCSPARPVILVPCAWQLDPSGPRYLRLRLRSGTRENRARKSELATSKQTCNSLTPLLFIMCVRL
jgi:hypothetical protein